MTNREDCIKQMISYIEEKEKDVQAKRISGDSKYNKTDIVSDIINKLESVFNNDN